MPACTEVGFREEDAASAVVGGVVTMMAKWTGSEHLTVLSRVPSRSAQGGGVNKNASAG
jgi:hypothetical protein